MRGRRGTGHAAWTVAVLYWYLKQGGLFDGWVPDWLLPDRTRHAKRDVLDTRWASNPIRSISVRIPLWETWMRALVCARIPQ